jgi:NodT family efflux transporter outer membrane factor (OMF) lipoprotein
MGAPVPVEPQPDVEAPPQFSRSGTAAPAGRWWTTFDDPSLDHHVERALAANRDLEGIWHAFREACAVARRTAAARYPVVDLLADASVARGSGDNDDEELSVGGAVDFEVDLWGRLEARRRADAFEAQASLEDYRTAAVSLTAEVARTWYRLLEAELQVAVLTEQVEANRKIRSLIEPRVAAQQLRGVDLLRQDALVESTREERIEAEADAAVLRHQLAVLTGRAPGAIPVNESAVLATLPPLPATGVPIECVRRRPDIRAAGNRVKAGDQELGAALRDRYPRLNLGASLRSATGIFEDFIATFAAGLLAPVADGGLRAAEIDRAHAQRDRLRAAYAQAVLVAFREVEDALVEERRQRGRQQSIERQLDLTRRSSARLRDEYLNGQGSYIEVLSALTNEQELRRELLAAQRLLLEARIGLHRALSGPVTHREEEP